MSEQQFVIRLAVNSSGVTTGINSATAQVDKLAKSVQGMFGKVSALRAGVLGAAVFAVGAKLKGELDEVSAAVKEIEKGVGETGLDPTTYQQVSNTLKVLNINAGVAHNSLEAVASAVEKIQKGEDVGGKLARSFAQLGVSLDDIKKKNHQQVWLQIAAAMKSLPSDTPTLNALGAVAGGKAGDLIPAFRRGFDTGAAGSVIMTDEDLLRVKRYNEAVEEMKLRWRGVGQEVGITLAKLATKVLPGGQDIEDPVGRSLQAKLNERLQARARTQADAEQLRVQREANNARQRELDLSRMNPDERRRAVETERRNLQLQMDRAGTDLEREQLRSRLLDVEQRLGRIATPRPDSARFSLVGGIDEQSRRGVFVGGRDSQNRNEVLAYLRSSWAEHRRLLEQQARNVESSASSLRNIDSTLREEA